MNKDNVQQDRVRNFDEYDQPERFKFRGEVYEIPPISQDTSDRLAAISERLIALTDEGKYTEANACVFEYVLVAMLGDDYTPEKLEEMRQDRKYRAFPRRMLHDLMSLINTMQGLPSEMTPVEEVKAKK